MLDLDLARKARSQKKNGNSKMRVISVTSGKGGVGKSSVVSNLALTLASQGQRVLLMDGDFGLANLDILLDMRASGTMHDVIFEGRDPQEILAHVAPNLDILPSSSGVLSMTNIGLAEKGRVLEVLQSLEQNYDVLLIDTGAGISDEVTWLNSCADEIIVVATPEPTSLADAYALIKVLNQKHKVKDFHLLVNQARTEAEALRVYQQITGVSDRFLNVSIDYFGFVLWDDLWTHSIRQRKPMVAAFPSSNAAKHFGRLADNITRNSDRMAAVGGNDFFKTLLSHA